MEKHLLYNSSAGLVLGEPEILQRHSTLHFTHEDFSSPFRIDESIVDMVPNRASESDWLCLTRSRKLYQINLRSAHTRLMCSFSDTGFEFDDSVVLYCSDAGDFGAICQLKGQFGIVFELPSGHITLRLDRGDYHEEVSNFSLGFFQSDGRTVVVSATAWNRLDIFDPASGQLLTDRTLPSPQPGQNRPDHDLDYFHAQLHISPGNEWIVDDGWGWHPMGIIRSWNLQAWCTRNVWESEDGPSALEFAYRDYWNGPICWIDDAIFALWGWTLGNCVRNPIAAVRLFDVETGTELRWFAGPECRYKNDTYDQGKTAPSLFFDKYLFSVGDAAGTSVWDVATGELLHHDGQLVPIHYHPRSQEFLSVSATGFRLSRLCS